jgi:hypothetical protein
VAGLCEWVGLQGGMRRKRHPTALLPRPEPRRHAPSGGDRRRMAQRTKHPYHRVARRQGHALRVASCHVPSAAAFSFARGCATVRRERTSAWPSQP